MTKLASARISVVIPAFRAADTISHAIHSLLVQSALAEIIVVVDGAHDSTAQIVRAMHEPRIRLFEQPVNRGAQNTRNVGLTHASAPLVLFLDADDYHEGDVLGGLAAAMEREKADVGFAAMQIVRTASARREPVFQPAWQSASDLFQQWFVERRYVIPAAVVWRTSYIRALNGWDETIDKNQDGELVIRAALAGAQIAISHVGRAVYLRAGGESVSSRADNLGSLLRVSEKVLATQSAEIDLETRRKACALHDYQIAWDCFERGADELGRIALARSRQLGFKRHRGPLLHRLVANLVGLRYKCLLFDAFKRRLGLPTKRQQLG